MACVWPLVPSHRLSGRPGDARGGGAQRSPCYTRTHADALEMPRCGVPARPELRPCPRNSSGRSGPGVAPHAARRFSPQSCRADGSAPRALTRHTFPSQVAAQRSPRPCSCGGPRGGGGANQLTSSSPPAPLSELVLSQIRPGPRRYGRGSRLAAVAPVLGRCAPG